MKNTSIRRNRTFASNLVHGTFHESVEQYKACEKLVSNISSIDKPYLQHVNKPNHKTAIDRVPVWLLKVSS